jgi:hypothetical protein
MQGRLESKSGEMLAEGRLTRHSRSTLLRLGPTLDAPASLVPGTPEVHWTIPGGGSVADGTEGVLITNGAERVDVVVINDRLHQRG